MWARPLLSTGNIGFNKTGSESVLYMAEELTYWERRLTIKKKKNKYTNSSGAKCSEEE